MLPGLRGERLVSGNEHDAAAGHVFVDRPGQQFAAVGVKRGERFVEHPQRPRRQQQARQCRALPLAGWLIAMTDNYRSLFVLGGAATLAAILPLLFAPTPARASEMRARSA